ncbi:TetR/AcrR family transcriptional regulator [Gracilibacillus dipsosauri]|uniref:TetR family transcriptional regulator n=1 Tax=Gracilibacillus dipsosauri TaxID=178340 RepID=A0A317KTP8_9BACI|nr:TetR/AcrR family transcriptional regulator [Gracilibacillus dipsosauri]PWU66911.1 TetR family transcriptional regulator [Gracilibacillus dipsosauri]
MDGFERRKQKKQNNILNTAVSLFLQKGIKSVSIAEIANTASVSQVTIYNYFGSKDKLLKQAMIFYVEELFGEYVEILDSDQPFPEKIKQFIFHKAELSEQIHEEVYEYLLNDLHGAPSFLEKIYQEKSIPFFHQLIQLGKKDGYINEQISEESIMMHIQMYKNFLQQKNIGNKILPYTEDIMNLFFYGIMGKEK